jgi:hypothetical protein
VLGVDVTVTIVVSVSLGSIISLSLSGDGFEWEFVRIEWVLWSGEWGGLKLSKSFPLTIVLGVDVTITIMISVSLGSVISLSFSGDGFKWKFVGVEWVLWGSKWSGINLSESTFPLSIVLRVDVTITVMISISLGSVICLSFSRNSFEWKLITIEWVLWGGKWSGINLSESTFPLSVVLGVDITISIMISISLGSVISLSLSGDCLEWKFVTIEWVLWGSKWCGVYLSKSSFPLSVVLGVDITISIMISISLGSVISLSLSGDGFEWKLIGVEWVLWSSEWSGLGLSKSSFPLSIVLGVGITVSIMISISLGAIIFLSISRDILEWELVGELWVLRSRNWSSVLVRIDLN